MSLPDRLCTISLGRKCYRAFNTENTAKVSRWQELNREAKRVGETRDDDLDCAQDFKSLTAKHILRLLLRASGHKDVLYTRPRPLLTSETRAEILTLRLLQGGKGAPRVSPFHSAVRPAAPPALLSLKNILHPCYNEAVWAKNECVGSVKLSVTFGQADHPCWW